MHGEWTDLVSAYLDGELDAVTRRRLEAHLAGCAACAAVRADLERIRSVAPSYRGEPPTNDLWPGIQAAIDPRGVVRLADRRPARRFFGLRQLLAAGLAASVIGAGALWYRNANRPATTAVANEPAEPGQLVPAAFVSKEYDDAVAELERTLATRRGSLDTVTVRVLEESLATIDRAIAEARAAVQRDTANVYLNEQIAGNLRKKLNVLRLATRAIASET